MHVMSLAYAGPVSLDEIQAAQRLDNIQRYAELVGAPLGAFLGERLHWRCPDHGAWILGSCGRPSLLYALARPCRFRLCPGHMDRPDADVQIVWAQRWLAPPEE